MDKVFKAIGRFFKKIWDWIKQTAWIQPLLIVAIIFGIIFSINPIVNAIQGAINADDTGEFYEAHAVQMRDLFAKGLNKKGLNNQKPNYESKNILNDNSGDILVIYVNDNSLESDVAAFYNSAEGQGCKLYICDLSTEANQRSKWDETGDWTLTYGYYQKDSAADYYDYLLDSFMEAYNDDSATGWRKSYSKEFSKKYGYEIGYPDFAADETYKITSTSAKDAYTDVKLPAAVKYTNGKIVDFRFAISGSWSGYGNENKSVNNISVLTDLWKGLAA